MKTLLLTLCLALATPLHSAERTPTDAEINRYAAQELAKARAARLAAASAKAEMELTDKRQREAAITVVVKVYQVIPGRGYLAKAIGQGATGPERIVERPREEWVQGTGLDAHKKVKRTWVDRTNERQRVPMPDLFFVHDATAGLIDGASVLLLLRPTEPYHYGAVSGAGKTVAGYSTKLDPFAP